MRGALGAELLAIAGRLRLIRPTVPYGTSWRTARSGFVRTSDGIPSGVFRSRSASLPLA